MRDDRGRQKNGPETRIASPKLGPRLQGGGIGTDIGATGTTPCGGAEGPTPRNGSARPPRDFDIRPHLIAWWYRCEAVFVDLSFGPRVARLGRRPPGRQRLAAIEARPRNDTPDQAAHRTQAQHAHNSSDKVTLPHSPTFCGSHIPSASAINQAPYERDQSQRKHMPTTSPDRRQHRRQPR